jgi:hypothetical protein
MANLYSVPLKNSVQHTLAGTLTIAETGTITLDSSVVLELQATATMKGLLVVDRVDVNGTLTPTKTEFISYTGVTGSTVTGLTRAVAGTTAQGHSIGAVVEFVPDITWAQSINDVITTQHNSDGTHKTLSLISLASVTLNNAMGFGVSFASGSFNNGFIGGVSMASSTLQNIIGTNVSLASVNLTNGYFYNPSLVSATLVNRAFIPVEQKFISSVATTTFDWAYSNIHSITLSAATTTLAFANPVEGQALITRLGQDGTGSRAIVFPSTIKWTGGTTPTLTSTASKTDVFGFLCTASGFYDGYTVGQNL